MQSECMGDVCKEELMQWLYRTAKSHQTSLNTRYFTALHLTYFSSQPRRHLSLTPSGRRSSVTGVHARVEIYSTKGVKQVSLPRNQQNQFPVCYWETNWV